MRSFSLIELLIVSAIIAVLSALLMPALSSAKLNAKDIQCVSNERQVHMALYLYCQDHDQRYPRFTSPSWQNQKDQLTMLSNYVGKLDFLRCPLANGDVINDPTQSAYFSQVISGKLQWSEYKIGDYESNLGAAPPIIGLMGEQVGTQLRPQMTIWVIDAMDWQPRHRGKENLCFGDGHVERLKAAQYNGVEPGRAATPVNWPNWGIEN